MFAECEESRIAFWVSRVFCVGVVIESAHSSAQSDGFSSSRAEFPAVRFADRCIALAGGEDLLPASDNLILTARTGEACCLIAVETEGREGTLTLDAAYSERLSGRTLKGEVAVRPYEVLVLVRA